MILWPQYAHTWRPISTSGLRSSRIFACGTPLRSCFVSRSAIRKEFPLGAAISLAPQWREKKEMRVKHVKTA